MKLTQGTGTGTCRWNNKNMTIIFKDVFIFEDLLIIFFIYSIFKYVLSSIFIEIFWITSFFNKKNNIIKKKQKLKNFSENQLKILNNNNSYKKLLFFIFLKYFY